jgi:hypothetical protein
MRNLRVAHTSSNVDVGSKMQKGDKVKRFITLGLLATASVTLGVAGCAQNGFATVAVTKSASLVASCQGMGEVKASSLTPDNEAQRDLVEAARSRGANTLLVQSDNARTGTAYQCSMPATAANSSSAAPGR